MRTSQEETQKNYNTIIQTAIKVFSERGYEAANMQDVAEAAGISRGPLYYHFKNKSTLYHAAVQAYANKELAEYRRIFSTDMHILEKIREDMYYCTRGIRGHAYNLLLTTYGNDELKESEKFIDEHYNLVYDIKLNSTLQAIEKGEMRKDVNPRQIVNHMFVCFEGLRVTVQDKALIKDEDDINAIIEDMLALINMKYCR